ncbi:hypothetical protein HY489_04360 [Candidatus Woesearchaeota archaeon]|nr:hypothetical protein [Candidatus Woesearchaeota archaeon]
MVKRLLLFVLLAVSVVAQANVPYDSQYPSISTDQVGNQNIQRFSDFPLDNIHILRLQEAATSLGGNVSLLRTDLQKYQQDNQQQQSLQAEELSRLRGSMDVFQRSTLAQVSGLQSAIEELSKKADSRPSLEVPAPIFPPYLVILLGLNVVLLILVIILIFWLREQYYVHKETHAEEHIHPAPKDLIEYVKHQFEHKKPMHEVRMELAGKGWTPSIIEHAIHAAREK